MSFRLRNTPYALLFALAFLGVRTPNAHALPLPSFSSELSPLLTQVACKYGSGKCADVKPIHQAPSTEKHGPQDPTVDPDCGHYGNCRGGNPEGNSASAKRDPSGPKAGAPTSVMDFVIVAATGAAEAVAIR